MPFNIENLTLAELRNLAQVVAGLGVAGTAAGAAAAATATEPLPVVVCTAKRAVVFGWTLDPKADPITLARARMALYWSADVGGIMGLADIGQQQDAKISATAPSISLSEITAVLRVSADAARSWVAAKVQGR